MKRTSARRVRVEIISVDPDRMKHLPKTVPEIERWIIAIGGKKVGKRERAVLKRRGLIGMPSE